MLLCHNHRITRAITMTILAIGLLNLVEGFTDNIFATTFGWIGIGVVILVYGSDIADLIVWSRTPSDFQVFIWYGVCTMITLILAVANPSDNELTRAAFVAITWVGLHDWKHDLWSAYTPSRGHYLVIQRHRA